MSFLLVSCLGQKNLQCPTGTLIRAALLNIACDIPAARKTAGFTSHSSTRACHKCTREFIVFPGTSNLDYSGHFIDHDNGLRNHDSNAAAARRWMEATSQVERKRIERETGTRWSQIHRLRYFDPVKSTVIDPMHNLFLGTCKRMVTIWKTLGFFDTEAIKSMQKSAGGILAPPGTPPMQQKIGLEFGYMTANHWKAWCLIYSPFVLKNIIPQAHLTNWMYFVDACRLIAKVSLNYNDIDEADDLLKKFVQGCTRLYGPEFITPNMHLHLHLRDIIEDFGPMYAFWVFSFERYNGFMKNTDTNQKDSFELTFMRRFVERTGALDFIRSKVSRRLEEGGYLAELDILEKIGGESSIHLDQEEQQLLQQQEQQAEPFDPLTFDQLSSNPQLNVIGSEPIPTKTRMSMLGGKEMRLNDHLYGLLLEHYRDHYHNVVDFRTPNAVHYCTNHVVKFRTIDIFGQKYRSASTGSTRGSYIQVLFLPRFGDGVIAWSGQVQFYFRHNQDNKEHYFAYVRWYRTEAREQRFVVEGLEEWRSRFMDDEKHSILPIHRIYSQIAIVAYGPQNNPNTSKIVIIPGERIVHV